MWITSNMHYTLLVNYCQIPMEYLFKIIIALSLVIIAFSTFQIAGNTAKIGGDIDELHKDLFDFWLTNPN